MKTKCLLALITLLFSTPVFAADIHLTWTPSPSNEVWDYVRIYERTGTTYTKVAEVIGSLTEATIPNVNPGVHTYIARSVNMWGESDNSNTASTPLPPSPPNLSVTITLTVTVTK